MFLLLANVIICQENSGGCSLGSRDIFISLLFNQDIVNQNNKEP